MVSNQLKKLRETTAPNESSSSAAYPCLKCNLWFTTGRALGGHQRTHYDGHFRGKKAKLAAETSRDFDLNFPPPPDDEFSNYGLSGRRHPAEFDLNLSPEEKEEEEEDEEEEEEE